jgi:hypothetical protein
MKRLEKLSENLLAPSLRREALNEIAIFLTTRKKGLVVQIPILIEKLFELFWIEADLRESLLDLMTQIAVPHLKTA